MLTRRSECSLTPNQSAKVFIEDGNMKLIWISSFAGLLIGTGSLYSQEPLPARYPPPVMTFTMESPDGYAQPIVMMSMPGTMPVEPEQLINVPDVWNDLQLVDDQRSELKAAFRRIREEYAARQQELTKELLSNPGQPMPAPMTQEMQELQQQQVADFRKAVDEILLPFQSRRLKEIAARARITNEGAAAFQSGALFEELGLSDDQKKKLAEKQQEMEAQLREDYKELRRKRQWEVIESVLSSNQQSKLKEMLGQELEPRNKKDSRPDAAKKN